jgi:hypothetical protein
MASGAATTPRHAKQRAWFLGLDGLAWMVRNLIVIRALQLAHARSRRLPRSHGRGEPKRNLHLRRAAAGSRLRRALRDLDMMRRIARCIDALKRVDDFAAPLAERLKRRLTRLAPVLTKPCVAQIVRVFATPAPFAADSS